MRTQLIVMICWLLLAACGGEDESPAADALTAGPPSARVSVSEASVFEAPSREAALSFRLIEGDQVPIVSRTTPDDFGVTWYQVGQGQRFGWVAGSQIVLSGDVTPLRVVDLSAELPTPTATEPPATPTPRLVVVPDGDVPARVIVSEGLVFEAPDRDSAQAASLFEGELVQIIGRLPTDATPDEFLLVGRQSRVLGWMLAAQLDVQGELTNVPLLEDANAVALNASPTPSQAAAPPDGTLTEPPADTETPAPDDPTAIRLDTTPLVATVRAAPTATVLPEDPVDGAESAEATGTPGPVQGELPPLSITLPEGWQQAHALVPINTAYLQGALPVSLYQGPLSDGVQGSLWLIYGFPNVTSPSGEINLLGDGVQLLRGLVLDPITCEVGLSDETREYRVGDRAATGTIYSAVNCANSPDVAGFFAVLQVGGGNFAFFAGVEPVEAVGEALPQMQAILESVAFDEALSP